MPTEFPWSPEDEEALGTVWTEVVRDWSMEKLGRRLGVTKGAISLWCSRKRRGPMPALRAALRITALERPDRIKRLAETLIHELMGVEVEVVVKVPDDDLDWDSESDDVDIARGDLTRAMRDAVAPPTLIEHAADRFESEAREAAEAARQVAARRRSGAA